MTRRLPPKAHLRQLKHQARDVLHAHGRREPGVCGLLRRLQRFERASDEAILDAPLKLTDVQFALALDYGFSSWNALKKHVGDAARWAPGVERDDDAVYLGGLERAAWGGPHPKQNTVVAAFEAAVATHASAPDYDSLMAVSGAAFRLQFKWCPSSPHACCGFDCSEPMARASGYRVQWLHTRDPHVGDWRYAENRAPAHERATRSIDGGRAVLWSNEECGLLVGYAESGEWLIRPHGAREPGYTRSSDWPWSFGIVQANGAPLAGIERAVHVLQTALQLAHTPAFEDYTSGFAAYDRWVRELSDDALFELGKGWFQVALGNAHTYASLADARAAGARFLARMADELPDAAAAPVRRAGQALSGVSALITTGDGPKPWQLFPWSFAAPSAWTRDQRLAQARVLEAACDAERRAISELHAALDALGVRPGEPPAST